MLIKYVQHKTVMIFLLWLPASRLCPVRKHAAAPSYSPWFQTDGPPDEPDANKHKYSMRPNISQINITVIILIQGATKWSYEKNHEFTHCKTESKSSENSHRFQIEFFCLVAFLLLRYLRGLEVKTAHPQRQSKTRGAGKWREWRVTRRA